MIIHALIYGMAGLSGLFGLLLFCTAIAGGRYLIDIIVGKGDMLPGTNPSPTRDRFLMGLVGMVLFLFGLWLFRAGHG